MMYVAAYFSGSKLKWLLDRDRSLRRRAERGELCFGTIETWLIYRLSHGESFVTDFTNASRTMMLNLDSLRWDPEMLRMLDVPEAILPQPVPSRGPLGEAVRGALCDRAIPIGAAIGDQQAALFGQGCVRAGAAKVTYGTGAFLLMHTGNRRVESRNRLLSTAALGLHGEAAFALEGSVFIAGAVIQWLRDELGLIARSADSAAIARRSADRGHPYMVPAFVGLGAPYWDSEARGAVVGITRGTTRADIVRAALDGIAYQVNDVIAAMEKDTGRRISALRVDGGAAANDYLMEFQADLLGRPVLRPKMAETTALGAAMLAGISAGIWTGADALGGLRGADRAFAPKMKPRERTALIVGWREAVSRVVTNRNARCETASNVASKSGGEKP
jgi:glycerol kinase